MAWSNRGNALIKLKKYRKSVKSYDKALESKSDQIKIWTGRAWSLYKLRKYEESNKDYERVLKIKPDYQVAKDNQEIVRKKLTKS